MKIIAVTSCPVGMAHTYMAAAALKKAAQKLGHEIKVETQGSMGIRDKITQEEVSEADIFITAADVAIMEGERFEGIDTFETTTGKVIRKSETVINEAIASINKELQENNETEANASSEKKSGGDKNGKKESFFGDVRKHLMSGVSFMLPVIIIYAFFMVLGQIPGGMGELCTNISDFAKMMIGPVLAAYIAFSIVGKLALAPAFVIGMMSEQLGMGFIGGLIVGLLVGYMIKVLVLIAAKFKQGQANDILMSFIIVPVVATLAGGALVYFLIAAPVTSALDSVYKWLETMSTGNAILLATILGAMIAFDMGGPVNKVAYTFAIAASTEGLHHVVAPVLVAITIPVLSVGLATVIMKKKYTDDERLSGKTALFMSIFGLTEGAIPFAVVNPFRVIPAFIIGSAAGAALTAAIGVVNTTVIPSLVGIILGSPTLVNTLLYVLCHLVGVAVTITMLMILKKKK